jgi:hypothetical protein
VTFPGGRLAGPDPSQGAQAVCAKRIQNKIGFDRVQWGIEIMQGNKDVIPGEDSYPNRDGNAPRNVFPHRGAVLVLDKILNRFPWVTTLIVI